MCRRASESAARGSSPYLQVVFAGGVCQESPSGGLRQGSIVAKARPKCLSETWMFEALGGHKDQKLAPAEVL